MDWNANAEAGDSIHSKNEATGTLGEFVTKTNNDQKLYASICNHLFAKKNEVVYIYDLGEIGTCMFTTRDKGCDFLLLR